MELDLNLRVRVAELEAHLGRLARPGLLETSPGVRSVTIEYDQRRLPLAELLRLLEEADARLPLARPAARGPRGCRRGGVRWPGAGALLGAAPSVRAAAAGPAPPTIGASCRSCSWAGTWRCLWWTRDG
jgi:hypothetical protein